MNKGMAAMVLGQMLAMNGLDWKEDGYIVEKSDLPKKEPMPLTEEEEVKLSTLHGREKKIYLKSLKAKYSEGES